jgi:hypothetical protein
LIYWSGHRNLRSVLQVKSRLPDRAGYHASSPVALGAIREVG